MSARFLVLAFLVAAPSAFAAGHWQGQHAPVEDDQLAPRVNAPIITRPGTGAAEAVRYLSGVTTPTVVATGPVAVSAPRPASTAPAGPPPEDISIRFRRDVTAVLTNGEPHIVLAGGRRIGSGEVYSDGWRVRDISSQRATLAKGRETRSIDLFSPPPLQPTQLAAAAPVMTGPVSFSNGLLPDQRAGQAARMTVQSQQAQQMQLLEQLRARLTQQPGQRGGFGGFGGNNNNNGANNRGGGGRNFNAAPNGGFGGGGFGGGGGGRQARQQSAPVTVTVTPPPPPPPPPPAPSGDAD